MPFTPFQTVRSKWRMFLTHVPLGSVLDRRMRRSRRRMQIHLQQISSGKFLTAEGNWTKELTEAKAFDHFLEALVYARDTLNEPVGAYCAFEEPSYDFSVYLRDASAARRWETIAGPLQRLLDTERQLQRG